MTDTGLRSELTATASALDELARGLERESRARASLAEHEAFADTAADAIRLARRLRNLSHFAGADRLGSVGTNAPGGSRPSARCSILDETEGNDGFRTE